MEKTNPLNPDIERPFLFNWILANIVGLPVLLGPYSVGLFLLMMVAIFSDGGLAPSRWYAFNFVLQVLSGAVMGAYLGHMQSFPLKTRIPQSGKWIAATSLGVAVGTPLSWLVYQWMFASPLVNGPRGIFFFYLYQYLIFGILLGLSVGVAQWFVLKQQVRKAEWWIVALPILFSGGMAFTKIGFLYLQLMRSVQQWMPTITDQSFEIRLPVFVNYLFLVIVPSLIALVMVSLLSGVFLEWLFQFQKKQSEGQ